MATEHTVTLEEWRETKKVNCLPNLVASLGSLGRPTEYSDTELVRQVTKEVDFLPNLVASL